MKVLAGVIIGTRDRWTDEDANFKQQLDSHFWVTHPAYNKGDPKLEDYLVNDIALLMVDRPFVFKDKTLGDVKPAFILNAVQQLNSGDSCYIYGWGPSLKDGEKEDGAILRRAGMVYKGESDKNLYFNTTDMSSSSYGDSGGAVYCNNVVHGIISHGNNEAEYVAKIFPHIKWMEQVIITRTPGLTIRQNTVYEDPGFIAIVLVKYKKHDRFNNKQHIPKCHGAFIGNGQWVITAAHCFDPRRVAHPNKDEVEEVDFTTVESVMVTVPHGDGEVAGKYGQVKQISKKFYKDEEYDMKKNTLAYDVGLVYLEAKFPENVPIIPAVLPDGFPDNFRLSYYPADADELAIYTFHGGKVISVDAEEALMPRKLQKHKDKNLLVSVEAVGAFTPFSAILHDDRKVFGVKIHMQNFKHGAKQFYGIGSSRDWINSCMEKVGKGTQVDVRCKEKKEEEAANKNKRKGEEGYCGKPKKIKQQEEPRNDRNKYNKNQARTPKGAASRRFGNRS